MSNSLQYERSKAVSQAWERERDLVRQGRGTRQWNLSEQKELLKTGRVKGYEGHHMKNVADHPEYAGDPKNIQFLDGRKGNNEHLKAHRGDYHNESDGRYNVRTEKIRAMKEGKPRAMNSYELGQKAVDRPGYKRYADPNYRVKPEKAANDKTANRAHVKDTSGQKKGENTGKSAAQSGQTSGKNAAQSGQTSGKYADAGKSSGKPSQQSGTPQTNTGKQSSYGKSTSSGSTPTKKSSGSYGKTSSPSKTPSSGKTSSTSKAPSSGRSSGSSQSSSSGRSSSSGQSSGRGGQSR